MLKTKILLFAVLIFTICVALVTAQENGRSKNDDLTLSQTPASRRMNGWLQVLNSGNAAKIKRFALENYSEAMLKQATADERTTKDLGLFGRTQGLQIRRIEKTEEFAVVVLAQEKLDESWVQINLEVEKIEPFKVVNFGIRRIPPPADLPSLPKMSESEAVKDLKKYLEKMVAADQFSGAVLLAKNGKPIFVKSYGLANKAFNIPNKTDTKFAVASIGKMFTAVAIVQLAEQGKISFDTPIIKYLPDYPNKTVAEKVTIHHLLTHTSGLSDFFNEKFEAKKTRLRAVQDYFPLFVDDPLRFEPGTNWRYSNAGFIVLGAIIEKVSGENYFDYIKNHVFKPAGMTNSDFYETDQNIPNLAIGYTEIGPDNRALAGVIRNNLMINAIKGSPAGGCFSTVEDLLRFDTALRQNKLLNEKSTNLILESKVAAKGGTADDKYAYGFMTALINGTRIVGHGGTSPGVNGKIDMYLDLGYSLIVLSNYDPRSAERVADRFKERILRK